MRLRYVARLNPPVAGLSREDAGIEVSFLPLERIWDDDRFDPSETIEFSGDVQSYNPVAEGDILLPKVSPTFAHGRVAIARGLTNGRGLATSEVFVIRAQDSDGARFLRYRLRAMDFRLEGKASWTGVAGLKRVSADFVRDTDIDAPSWGRRAAVADFLDRECDRIGELLLAKEHLATLGRIAEGERVRGDLDADAGALPAQKLGWHVEVLAGYAFPSEDFIDDPYAVRLLRGINVGVGRTDWSESAGWAADDVEPYRRWLLRAGDLVLGLDRPWITGGLRVAELTREDLPVLLLQRVACIRPFRDNLLSAYVRLWIEHERFFADLGSVMTGVSVPHLSPSQVAAFRVPVPDLERQVGVVSRAAEARASVARMATELEALRKSLAEYRDALITEAVTGKLDVTPLSEQQMDESAHAAMEGEAPEVLSA